MTRSAALHRCRPGADSSPSTISHQDRGRAAGARPASNQAPGRLTGARSASNQARSRLTGARSASLRALNFSPLLLAFIVAAVAILGAPLVTTWSDDSPFVVAAQRGGPQLVVYSGRAEPAVKPVFERFTEETGIQIVVRYGDTAQMAATIIEEGRRSPADVFFAQDAGALGSLSAAGMLTTLPDELLQRVDGRLQSPLGHWIGTSGRARVLVHNTDLVPVADAPDSIWELLDPKWRGRIGWAPTNGSFQVFVTALRVLEGEDEAARWLRGILANNPRVYPNNRAIVDAVIRGEISVGFVNHYYLFQFVDQHVGALPARNHFTTGDAGAIMNVAGVGVLESSANKESALRFVEFLLSDWAQQYFTDNNFEYPVVVAGSVRTNADLPPLAELDVPDIDLSNLSDLEGTLELLQRVGVL